MRGGREKPLDVVFETLRLQLARALLAKIREHVFAGKVARAQVMVTELTAGLACKRGMRLILDAALNPDLIDRVGGIPDRRIGRQLRAAPIEGARGGPPFGNAREPRVRA